MLLKKPASRSDVQEEAVVVPRGPTPVIRRTLSTSSENPDPPGQPISDACQRHARRGCHLGDAWWFDGCEVPEERIDSCLRRPCEDGHCVDDDAECLVGSRPPRCEGEVALGCSGGRAYAVDCGAQAKRCVLGEEGAACREITEDDCNIAVDRSRCDENVLSICAEGRWQRWECSRQRATCESGPEGARCVRHDPLPGADPACGVCGCPPSYDTPEVCDGRDNDADGFVDENLECPVVRLLPILIVGDGGEPTVGEETLAAELAQIERDFARDDGLGLTFVWSDPVVWTEPSWTHADERTLGALFGAEVPAASDGAFEIPVYFVEELLIDGVPRPGLATPPNGSCGGQRRTPEPQGLGGGVVLATPRWPTTLSHEIGHYLGLCHTHQAVDDVVVTEDPETTSMCREPCALEGDGVCDTPLDPGPPHCATGPECAVVCDTGARPDPANLMGYYPHCRNQFTAEQAAWMRWGASLRRGWHRCRDPRECPCNPLEPACPEDMTCSPLEMDGGPGWGCVLEGPTLPGGRCDDPAECGGGSVCVRSPAGDGRCVRPCAVPKEGCACEAFTGVDVSLCADDFEG